MSLKVAFYGNNLNVGYFFVRLLAERGVDATLFCIDYAYAQEHHDWWTDRGLDMRLVRFLGTKGFDIGAPQRLAERQDIRALYEEVGRYDVLVFMQEGPAVFSELTGPRKIFLSAGGDLQQLPFLLRLYARPGDMLDRARAGLAGALGGDWKAVGASRQWFAELPRLARIQARQRAGLRQCAAFVCACHQTALFRRLRLDRSKLHYLMLPMDASVLDEVDRGLAAKLREQYAAHDAVFFHPTRQFYLRADGDAYLKDNDKLLYAYAKFLRTTTRPTTLLLADKGRQRDIEHTRRLIGRLELEKHVEWLPELPNKTLRAYYTLPNVVVCDQYNPRIAMLGNIGRETVYFGRPLITAYKDWNRLVHGDDFPPNVFPAETIEEILTAMRRTASLHPEDKERVAASARAWFLAHLDSRTVMPKYIELIVKTATRDAA
jgi:glycosyltransferase involved in cell wall biosynthesis